MLSSWVPSAYAWYVYIVPPFCAEPPSEMFSRDKLLGLDTEVPMLAKPCPILLGEASIVLEEKPSNLYVGFTAIDVVSIPARLTAEACQEKVPFVSTSRAVIV